MSTNLVLWWLTREELDEIGSPVELAAWVQRDFEKVREFVGSEGILAFPPEAVTDPASCCAEILPKSDLRWAEAIGIHCSRCNGLVVPEDIAERIWDLDLPGMLTTLALRRWCPQIRPGDGTPYNSTYRV